MLCLLTKTVDREWRSFFANETTAFVFVLCYVVCCRCLVSRQDDRESELRDENSRLHNKYSEVMSTVSVHCVRSEHRLYTVFQKIINFETV